MVVLVVCRFGWGDWEDVKWDFGGRLYHTALWLIYICDCGCKRQRDGLQYVIDLLMENDDVTVEFLEAAMQIYQGSNFMLW